jgi:hypothetical protein
MENKDVALLDRKEASSEVGFLRKEFNEMKGKIEFSEADRPKVDIPDYGLEQLKTCDNSLDSLKGESGEKGVYAIIRCWGKDLETVIKKNKAGQEFKVPGLRELLSNLKRVKEHVPYLKGAFLVINQEDEKEDKTSKNLQKLLEEGNNEFPIVPLKVTRYSWTSGLNAPISILKKLMEEKNIDPQKVIVMPYSFDVDVPNDELKKCKEQINKGNQFFCTFRLNPSGEHPLAKWDRQTWEMKEPTTKELIEDFKNLVLQPTTQKIAKLVSTNRNTFNLILMKWIVEKGGFNPLCNSQIYEMEKPETSYQLVSNPSKPEKFRIAGMEDIELFYRIISNAAESLKSNDPKERAKWRLVIRNFYESFKDPIKYNDESWKNRPLGDILYKVGDESTAFLLIAERHSSLAKVNKVNSPEKSSVIRLGPKWEVKEEIQDFRI